MPGYHGTKVSFQPEMHMMHQPRTREGLYPRNYPTGKMGAMPMAMPANPMNHPMFEALRARHAHERADYARMMKAMDHGKMGGDGGYPTFDSLKLLGSENDANYLDVFMNEGAKHHPRYASDDSTLRPRSRSYSQTSKSNTSKRHSVHVDNIKKTILGSLRSAASDENIYESVEVIQYRKTIEAIKRQTKLRTVSKTGHSLFDHLRVEKVLKSGKPNQHRNSNSDGGSNSHSSSGSGDEFDYVRKPNTRFSRREVLVSSRDAKKKPQQQQQQHQQQQQQLLLHPQEYPTHHNHHKTTKRESHHHAEAGSESDDDWAIPRPKICEGAVKVRSRRTGAAGLMTNGAHDESDSSSKSTGLR